MAEIDGGGGGATSAAVPNGHHAVTLNIEDQSHRISSCFPTVPFLQKVFSFSFIFKSIATGLQKTGTGREILGLVFGSLFPTKPVSVISSVLVPVLDQCSSLVLCMQIESKPKNNIFDAILYFDFLPCRQHRYVVFFLFYTVVVLFERNLSCTDMSYAVLIIKCNCTKLI